MDTANTASTTAFEDRAPTFPGGGVGARTGPDADGRPASPVSGEDSDHTRGDAEYRPGDVQQADALWDNLPEEREVGHAPSREVGASGAAWDRPTDERGRWRNQWILDRRPHLIEPEVDAALVEKYERLLAMIPVGKGTATLYGSLERAVDAMIHDLGLPVRRVWPPPHWRGDVGFAHGPKGGVYGLSLDTPIGKDEDGNFTLHDVVGKSITDRNVDVEEADESEALNEAHHDIRVRVLVAKLLRAHDAGRLPYRDLVMYLEHLLDDEPAWPAWEGAFRVCAYDGCEIRVYAYTPAEVARTLGVTNGGGRPRAYCEVHADLARKEAARVRASKYRQRVEIRLHERDSGPRHA